MKTKIKLKKKDVNFILDTIYYESKKDKKMVKKIVKKLEKYS